MGQVQLNWSDHFRVVGSDGTFHPTTPKMIGGIHCCPKFVLDSIKNTFLIKKNKMRNFLFRSSLLFAIFLFVISCKKDTANDLENLPLGTLMAKIDGQEFESTAAAAILLEQTSTSKLFSISAADGGEIFNISFILSNSATLENESYADCENFPDVCLTIMVGEFLSALTDGTGNGLVDLSFIDFQSGGSAAGTFSGILTDAFGNVKEVTDGQFNVNIL